MEEFHITQLNSTLNIKNTIGYLIRVKQIKNKLKFTRPYRRKTKHLFGPQLVPRCWILPMNQVASNLGLMCSAIHGRYVHSKFPAVPSGTLWSDSGHDLVLHRLTGIPCEHVHAHLVNYESTDSL